MSKGAKTPSAPVVQAQTTATQDTVPEEDDAAIEEARQKELLVAQKKQGRAASLLADQAAVSGPAPVARKTLLGQ